MRHPLWPSSLPHPLFSFCQGEPGRLVRCLVWRGASLWLGYSCHGPGRVLRLRRRTGEMDKRLSARPRRTMGTSFQQNRPRPATATWGQVSQLFHPSCTNKKTRNSPTKKWSQCNCGKQASFYDHLRLNERYHEVKILWNLWLYKHCIPWRFQIDFWRFLLGRQSWIRSDFCRGKFSQFLASQRRASPLGSR